MNSKHKILVVDDDAGIRDVLKIMLEDEGYAVSTAIDGKFIQSLMSDKPDVILLDIWLAGTSGEEICKKLKETKNTKSIPIIVVSANVDTERITKRIGADDFVLKPFSIEELLAKVSLHCQKTLDVSTQAAHPS